MLSKPTPIFTFKNLNLAKPQKFIAKVVSHKDLAPNVFEKTFEMVSPSELNYEAGNYTSVKVNDGKTPPVYRAYTFASCGSNPKQFKLCVKLFCDEEGNEGRGSGYLKNLKEGEEAEFFGPAGEGSFATEAGDTTPLFLFGTGTGIAPLKALAEKLTNEKSSRKITLFLGVSYFEDIFYKEEFEEIKKENPNFDYKIGVSRPKDDYEGLRGRLPQILDEIDLPKDLRAMICGSEASVAGIKQKLIELGIDEQKIDAEGYGEV
jgi:NAD(P)H-flavin reductase